MRYLMKRSWPICRPDPRCHRWFVVKAFDFSCYVEEALGSQKEPRSWTKRAAYKPYVVGELRPMALGGEVEVCRSTFSVKARGNRYTLDERGLSTAVFADEDCHAWIQIERPNSPEGGKAQGIRAPINITASDFDAANECG